MSNRRFRSGGKTVALVAATCLAAAACANDATPAASSGDERTFVGLRGAAPVALSSDRDCDAVLEDFQTFAPTVVADQLFFSGMGGAMDGEATVAMDDAGDMDAAPAAPAADRAEASTGADGATSDTNNQEAGIDEPDVVETDGDHVYLVDQQDLVILDGATAEVLSRTGLASYGAQLLLQGDRLLVIAGGGYGYAIGGPAIGIVEDDAALVEPAFDDEEPPAPTPDEPPADEPLPVEPLPEPVPLPGPIAPPDFQAGTVLQLVDVSDPAAPAIVETTEIEGNHISTRVVDGVARVVVTSYPQPQPLADDEVMSRLFSGEFDGADEAHDIVAAALSETTIEDWLPAFRTTTADDTSIEGSLVACEDVFVPEVNAGIAETSVLRVDFTDGFDPADTTTVVAEASTVYASASTLYLAANRYVTLQDQQGAFEEDFSTAVQAFDLRGDGAAAHLGGGVVPGHLLNQFSLSEHDGHLRIATTEGAPWGSSADSQSGVRVLRLEGAELVEVGAVTGLGVTETIQSVRFMGDVGYVVTFRQTDPLYVIDLSDPTAPEAVGELKIPGFSSYLHPIGEGRLVGIGRDADLEGRDQGLLVSLFDVSDPTAPAQIQTYVERNAWSQAGNDAKAFLWWAPEDALAIPIERFGPRELSPVEPDQLEDDIAEPIEEFGTGIAVLDVSDDGISERGTVTFEGRYASRALVVQGQLWSLFDGAVAVSGFDDVTDASVHRLR